MPRVPRALALAALAACLPRALAVRGRVAAAPPPSTCPVASCLGAAAAAAANSSSAKKGGEEEGNSPFNISFKPGHFICKSCDTSACKDCAVICNLEHCTGEFYTQQCWCEEESLSKKTHKVYCDEDCSGGICDEPGFRCRSRKDACKPWWWCGEQPPKWGPSSFLGLKDSLHRRSQQQQQLSTKRRRREASALSSGRRLASASALERAGVAGLSFMTGRFDCYSAAMPPKVWDEQALMWLDRGYVILDRRTCQGSVFDKECFCWDDFKYLSGKDPLTSELKCDGRCKMGPCDGKTCSRKPPPPLPPPTSAPGVAASQQTREGRLIMEPVDKPVLTGA